MSDDGCAYPFCGHPAQDHHANPDIPDQPYCHGGGMCRCNGYRAPGCTCPWGIPGFRGKESPACPVHPYEFVR